MVWDQGVEGSNPFAPTRFNKKHHQKWWCFLLNFDLSGAKGCARVSTAHEVPFENEVFVGDSQQGTHGEYADEQLTTIQKRICLIEFLFVVGLLFVKENEPRPDYKILKFVIVII